MRISARAKATRCASPPESVCGRRSTRGYKFNLYVVNLDGTGLQQVTHDPVFDAFPMFSFDGKKLIWSSNRNNKGTRDTNLFVAEWKD